MSTNEIGFCAYAASPKSIGDTIESAIYHLEARENIALESWKALDIVGHFISQEVTEKVESCDYIVADITVLNFNVIYEIGYAIGQEKKVLLVRNASIKEDMPKISDVGIFDTLGYESYHNSNQLASFIKNVSKKRPLSLQQKISTAAPVYLLEGMHKTDYASRVVSRIKKSRYIFRSFDPNEQARLSAMDAIDQIGKSYGVVIPLLSNESVGSDIHNIRGAFLAGLAAGMRRVLCLLQYGEEPVPIDYRDFVSVAFHPDDINEHIAEFAANIAEASQASDGTAASIPDTFLQTVELGAISAENEMRGLEKYYLKTDPFLKASRGEANIIVGRKGSGKSAIFLQVRDGERNRVGNIVLDLKPDGYKLVKFKELILSFLGEGTFQHTIMAFWEYVLLLEICYKILEKDRETHKRNHEIYKPYRQLADAYNADGYEHEGDFSERMSGLMEKISTEYRSQYGEEKSVRLSATQITEMLYFHDIQSLRKQVINYMSFKEGCWLLFDNIDKGWPTSGLEPEDLHIIRALIDASRKIAREFDRKNVSLKSIVFLRNDVYELLVMRTSDRGKEASVLLDWTDADLLRELIRLRLVSNNQDSSSNFENLWSLICVSHYKGEESSQYLIDRSLMRPRFLLNLISQCKGFAINLNHTKILEEDIEKGLKAYSTDLLADVGYEINDVQSGVEDVLYAFIGASAILSKKELVVLLEEYGIKEDEVNEIIDLLVWYGFLGYLMQDQDRYIYDFNYSMKLMKGIYNKDSDIPFKINSAFWPSLMIESER